MPSVFLVSDTHFSHLGVCRFLRSDGITKLRPWDSAEEMDEEMVRRWNDRVRPNDKVYHLGDVVMKRKDLSIMSRLNGDKVLIRGNHDIYKMSDYAEYFRDIRGYHVMNGLILSHIPIHEESLGRFGTNVHGHTHANRVMKDGAIDVRYHCVCVEQIDYTPILFEHVLERIEAEGGHVGFRNGNGPVAD
jgi:calcineurin-like phosphoesterase family protein